MKRRTVVPFALFASFLMITVAPIAGAATGDTLVVGSEHSTDTEFSNGTITDLLVVGSGSSATIQLDSTSESTATRVSDADSNTQSSTKRGIRINPNSDLDAVKGTLSSLHSGGTRVYIYDSTSGTLLNSTDISSLSSGDTFRIDAALDKGQDYNLVLDAEGADYTHGYNTDKSGLPASSEYIDIVDGANDATNIDKALGDIVSVTGIKQGSQSGKYVSDVHEVSNAEQSSVNITEVSNTEYTVTPQYYDGSSWVNATASTYSTAGEKTLDLPSVSSSQWRTRIDVEATGDNPAWTMASESVLFTDNPASASNPNLSGGTETNAENVDLSVDISDPQFGTAQGEEVTVEAFVDGSSIGTQTLSSAGTASFTASGLSDGNHSWHVEMADSYGVTSTSNTWIFEVVHRPATVSNLVPDGTETNNENVEVSFDIGDYDFAEPSGDSVDADLVVDGTVVNSWTGISSNQTLSYTVQGLADGQHDWYVGTTDEYGLTSTSSTASFTVNHYAPELSNFQPSDGSQLTSRTQNFTVDVTDGDFAEPSGDLVTVELFVDGNSAGTDTVSSNSTAQVSTTISEGGSHDYYWVATDEYGESTTSSTRSISVPSTLSIYNESEPTQLVTNATVELRMYTDELDTPETFTRSTTDGKINMTGLPVNQPFIVVASADNYTERRIFVPNLYETQSIYLLPDDEPAVDTVFSIQDYSGQFPQENTVLEVQRSLNGSYKTVLGDYFGANGEFTAQVAYNTRHRLVLRNIETGYTRALGTFTPIASGVETVAVSPNGTITIEDRPVSVNFPSMSRLPAGDTVGFNVSVVEGSQPIQSWTLEVVANGSTIYSDSTAGEVLDPQLNLSDYTGTNITATATVTLENGETRILTEEYRVTEVLKNDDSLLASVNRFVSLAPPENQDSMTTFLAMILTVFMTGAIRWAIPMPTEMTGLSAWLILAGFGVLGWVPYGMVFVAGVGAISFAYIGGVR